MNKYVCYYYYVANHIKKLGCFPLNANTRLGAIIKGTKIVKRFPKWTYLNTVRSEK